MTTQVETVGNDNPVVHIVDDDASVRAALDDLLESVGIETRCHGSTRAFLEAERSDAPGCLILDVRMPGQSGLDFQQHMSRLGIFLPVIFVTGHGDIAMAVRAMKAGAIDFLAKPFDDQALIDAVNTAIERDRDRRHDDAIFAALEARYASLSPGERDVMQCVAIGMPNKQIASQIGVSEITVKVRRAQLMKKMEAQSIADIVRFHDRLKGGVGK